MAKNSKWQDDYWLLLMQIYLQKPVGMKPLYSKQMVDLSLELHIAPEVLYSKMCEIANMDTARIEHLWETYGNSPAKLARAAALLRSMKGFNHADAFYDGVEMNESFELDFRPVEGDDAITPVMLILILDLYFGLTPATMVAETPEVQELARLLRLPTQQVVDVLDIFKYCDPYLKRRGTVDSHLFAPCRQIWQRYGNAEVPQLHSYASQLKAYFKSNKRQ